MANCKTCNKHFHACSGCCLDYSWEYDYCCEACFNKSSNIAKLKEVFKKLTVDELTLLDNSGEEEMNYVIRKLLEEKN